MDRILTNNVSEHVDKKILLAGRVQNVRKLGAITFLILEDRGGVIQIVWDKEVDAHQGDVIEVEGIVHKDDRAKGGFEIAGDKIEVISCCAEEMCFDISSPELNLQLTTLLDNRVTTVRHQRVKAIFKIYDVILKAYEQVMREEGFTEIKTPKLLGSLTEGGANFFEVKYFEKNAYLAQSPQFYKQIMVGAFERVFEIGPVFRAEPHFTTRHINEYISFDAEMGFIKSDADVRREINLVLKKIFAIIEKEAQPYLELLGVTLDKVPDQIPEIKLSKAKEIIKEKYGHEVPKGTDIDPEGERLICQYSREEFGSEFIFVTHYPWSDRPFYTMPADDEQKETLGFDLLYKQMEILTGSQRIHQYDQLIKNMELKKVSQKGMEFYLDNFKFGMPPHGGWAFGSARLVQVILGLSSIKEATLFPRDVKRISP